MTKPHTLHRIAASSGALLALFAAAPATAQDSAPSGWTVSLGAGGRLLPKFPGSDEIGVAPLIYGTLRREGRPLPITAPDDTGVIGLLGGDSAFDIGPAVRLVGKRDEEDVGVPVGDVDLTVEVGAFAQLVIGDNFRLRAEGRKAVNGHDGWVGDLGGDFFIRDGDRTLFIIGPRARYGDSNYHEAYFGVTPAAAAASGLPAYDPGGGFYAVGAITGITHMISRRWGVYGYAGYDRLIGDAADSPIVRTLGSRDQYSAGLGIFYSFNVGNLFGL